MESGAGSHMPDIFVRSVSKFHLVSRESSLVVDESNLFTEIGEVETNPRNVVLFVSSDLVSIVWLTQCEY
jgi:hypothetical protein